MMTLILPVWMVERIVAILEEHPYTGAGEIAREIRAQAAEAPQEPRST